MWVGRMWRPCRGVGGHVWHWMWAEKEGRLWLELEATSSEFLLHLVFYAVEKLCQGKIETLIAHNLTENF